MSLVLTLCNPCKVTLLTSTITDQAAAAIPASFTIHLSSITGTTLITHILALALLLQMAVCLQLAGSLQLTAIHVAENLKPSDSNRRISQREINKSQSESKSWSTRPALQFIRFPARRCHKFAMLSCHGPKQTVQKHAVSKLTSRLLDFKSYFEHI